MPDHQYTYTLDDFTEAAASQQALAQEFAQRQARKRPKIWLILIFMATIVFGVLHIRFPQPGHNPILDLVIPLLTLIGLTLTFNVLAIRRIGKGSATRIPLKFLASWLLVLGAVVFILFVTRRSSPSSDHLALWLFGILSSHLVWIAILVGLVITTFAQQRSHVRKHWETSPLLREPQHMSYTDSGITLSTALSRSEFTWYAFTHVLESQNLFLLFQSDLSFYIIPKRAFADSNDLSDFRQTLDHRITHRPAAFPVQPLAPATPPAVPQTVTPLSSMQSSD